MAFEEFLDKVGEKHRMEAITSTRFHFSFKQKICQIIKNTDNYEDAICYSTKEHHIAMNGNNCHVFDIEKLKTYLNLDVLFIEEDEQKRKKIFRYSIY